MNVNIFLFCFGAIINIKIAGSSHQSALACGCACEWRRSGNALASTRYASCETLKLSSNYTSNYTIHS